MKWFMFVLLALIIPLSGCCVKESSAFECVADDYDVQSVPNFYIDAAMPQDAVLTDSCDDGCCAVFSHDDFEIYQEIFEAEDLDDACKRVTGRTPDELSAIRTQDFPYEEYRFAYHAAGEGQTLSCSGTLFFDGKYCYAVSIRCPMEKEPMYHETFSDLLSLAELKAV